LLVFISESIENNLVSNSNYKSILVEELLNVRYG